MIVQVPELILKSYVIECKFIDAGYWVHTQAAAWSAHLGGHVPPVVDGRHVPEDQPHHGLVAQVEHDASLVSVLVLLRPGNG